MRCAKPDATSGPARAAWLVHAFPRACQTCRIATGVTGDAGRAALERKGTYCMIGYVTLGTNDIERAAAFYDELLSHIGAGRFLDGNKLNCYCWNAS